MIIVYYPVVKVVFGRFIIHKNELLLVDIGVGVAIGVVKNLAPRSDIISRVYNLHFPKFSTADRCTPLTYSSTLCNVGLNESALRREIDCAHEGITTMY